MPERLIRWSDAFMVPEVKKYPQKVLVMTAKPHPVRIWKFGSNENTPYFGIKKTAENMTCDVREEKGQLPSR